MRLTNNGMNHLPQKHHFGIAGDLQFQGLEILSHAKLPLAAFLME
jgi:hypothetical protein